MLVQLKVHICNGARNAIHLGKDQTQTWKRVIHSMSLPTWSPKSTTNMTALHKQKNAMLHHTVVKFVQLTVNTCNHECTTTKLSTDQPQTRQRCDTLSVAHILTVQIDHQHDLSTGTWINTWHNTIWRHWTIWRSAFAITNANASRIVRKKHKLESAMLR